MVGRFSLIVILFLIGSCTVTLDKDKLGPFPENYKDIVAHRIKETFYDPYSMRDVSISLPQSGHMLYRQGWIVCLESNAKNRMGGYVGLQRTAYLINRGSIIDVFEDAPMCNEVSIAPWPEMEGN